MTNHNYEEFDLDHEDDILDDLEIAYDFGDDVLDDPELETYSGAIDEAHEDWDDPEFGVDGEEFDESTFAAYRRADTIRLRKMFATSILIRNQRALQKQIKAIQAQNRVLQQRHSQSSGRYSSIGRQIAENKKTLSRLIKSQDKIASALRVSSISDTRKFGTRKLFR
jgi:hypothetical protein